jgi:hypothetical protein
MIIRPFVKREFTALPNAILNDSRLSADTRGMLAYILSKPKTWQVRPRALAKALSGPIPLGLKRLSRMFHEASAAGYMIRSKAQEHKEDGSFGRYTYFVGMPEDIMKAVDVTKNVGLAIVQELGVPFLPQRPEACTPHACTRDGTSYKIMSLEKTESIKTPLPPNSQQAAQPNGRPRKKLIEGQETVQHRLAKRIGLGDVKRGWEILILLPNNRRDELTASERAGRLTDDMIAVARASAELEYRA